MYMFFILIFGASSPPLLHFTSFSSFPSSGGLSPSHLVLSTSFKRLSCGRSLTFLDPLVARTNKRTSRLDLGSLGRSSPGADCDFFLMYDFGHAHTCIHAGDVSRRTFAWLVPFVRLYLDPSLSSYPPILSHPIFICSLQLRLLVLFLEFLRIIFCLNHHQPCLPLPLSIHPSALRYPSLSLPLKTWR
ncbi:hypothetical protein K435DRAFT_92096 [Dendrothele bispora CBS 962.96]|uniref:Uncharacterized protein n=1 Tax=Dendrothele bispora (strain CBS 962.96) TaxID=1314807 RepID=A0A4V4HI77_DENBC|nr:hypothetical protein K435DRAFT_92096 [Dendrothele bispora CBS 962.96]